MAYNRLLEVDGDCVSSMILCAEDLGLITPGSLCHIKLPQDSTSCGALFAGRNVIEQCLRERKLEHLSPEIWQEIEAAIATYKAENKLVHERHATSRIEKLECGRLMPIIIDSMLQKLTPYIH